MNRSSDLELTIAPSCLSCYVGETNGSSLFKILCTRINNNLLDGVSWSSRGNRANGLVFCEVWCCTCLLSFVTLAFADSRLTYVPFLLRFQNAFFEQEQGRVVRRIRCSTGSWKETSCTSTCYGVYVTET